MLFGASPLASSKETAYVCPLFPLSHGMVSINHVTRTSLYRNVIQTTNGEKLLFTSDNLVGVHFLVKIAISLRSKIL